MELDYFQKIQLEKLSIYASNLMGRAGCNDFGMPNTAENRAILRAAHIWNHRGVESAAREDLNDFVDKYEKEDASPMILTSDFLIFDYLINIVLKSKT